MQDTWADDQGVIGLDKHQNCNAFKIRFRKNATKFTFQRKFDTCDPKDYIIEEGTTHIVWARGNALLYKVSGLNISSPNGDKGMTRVQILKNTQVNADLPQHVKVLDILTDQIQIPSNETTYWCHVHKLSEKFKQKHHVYRVMTFKMCAKIII